MGVNKQTRLILGLGCLLVWLLPVGAMAQIQAVEQSIPKITQIPLQPKAEFEAQTILQQEKAPLGDEGLGYSLRLPKDWGGNLEQSTVNGGLTGGSLSTKVISPVAKYIGPPRNLVRSQIIIDAIKLDRGIDLKSWIKNHILTGGQTIAAMNEISPKELEIIYVKVDRDLTFVVRSRVLLNGPNIIMVNYMLPQENYDEERAMQAQVLQSFTLLKNVDESAEELKEYGFLDQSYFNYPASWILKPREIYSIDRMEASLYHQIIPTDEQKDPIITGQIQIFVISKLLKTTLPDEIAAYKKQLNIPGFKLGPLKENITYTFKDGMRGQTQVYALEPEQESIFKPYEITVTVLEGKDFYYILHLLTPSRAHDFLTWSKNMAAFKVVNETLRRDKFVEGMEINDPYYDFLKQVE